MSVPDPLSGRYLATFRDGLKAIPEGERNDIVEEIRSHIAEATAAGRSTAEVLHRLGPSDMLARAYCAEVILAGAGRPLPRLLRAAAVLAFSGASSLIVIPTLAFLGVVFPVVGGQGLFGNIVRLFFNPEAHVYHSQFPTIMSPAAGYVTGMVISAAAIVFGICLLVVLKKYIQFVTGAVRASLKHQEVR